MTFYEKWYSTEVTNYSNTHAIYKFIFRNIRAIHDLSMYFPKFQNFKNSKLSKISYDFKILKKFQNDKIFIKLRIFNI